MMMVDVIPVGFIIIWIIMLEYMIIDLHYFNREMKLRSKMFEQNMKNIEEIFRAINDGPNKGVDVSIEKRIICQSCGYPMRILEETDNEYQCYCAACNMDRIVKKD